MAAQNPLLAESLARALQTRLAAGYSFDRAGQSLKSLVSPGTGSTALWGKPRLAIYVPHPKLAGVACVYQAHGALKVTRWIAVTTLIHAAFADLQPVLSGTCDEQRAPPACCQSEIRPTMSEPMTDRATAAPEDLLRNFGDRSREGVFDALVKLKLVHGRGTTVLLPDLLIINDDGWRWFRPKFFSPCMLAFTDDSASAIVGFEPTPGLKLSVATTRDRLVRSYGDGSFLFRCRVLAPRGFRADAWPRCTIDEEHVVWVDLFHHTTEGAKRSIRADRHFRGSRWNIQGTKVLSNVEYVYFTDLRRIRTDEDLKRIAMASDGTLHLLPTNGTPPDDIIAIEVYRQSTFDRQHTACAFRRTA